MEQSSFEMVGKSSKKTVVVGAGPVGALAALYAATRGDEVEVYELRDGMYSSLQRVSHPFMFPFTVNSSLYGYSHLVTVLLCFSLLQVLLLSYGLRLHA
jgi:hypothetical protein